MRINNNYNPVRYVKSLYYANKKTTHYIEYPKKLKQQPNILTYIKKVFNKLHLK